MPRYVALPLGLFPPRVVPEPAADASDEAALPAPALYESPTMDSHDTNGPAAANPNATNSSFTLSVRFNRAGSDPMLPLMAAYTARCVVATPTPTAALHAKNMHKTSAGSENPSSPATPKSIPAAPCRKRPTIISAARPPSALVKLLNAFVAATVPTAKARIAPVHPGLYPVVHGSRQKRSGAAMISAGERHAVQQRHQGARGFHARLRSDAVSHASSFIGESVARRRRRVHVSPPAPFLSSLPVPGCRLFVPVPDPVPVVGRAEVRPCPRRLRLLP